MPPKKEAPVEEPVVEIVEPVVEVPEEEDTQAEDLAETVEALKTQLAEEQTRRVAAETRSSDLADRELGARTEAHSSNLHLVTNAIETLKQNSEVLTSSLAQANADQDHASAAAIQRQMIDNAAKLLQLEQGKEKMEATPAPVRETPITDPVEALASQLTPRSAAWVRKNPQYATDERLYRKMVAAHNLVIDEYVPDSDAYFEAIEGVLNPHKAPVENGADPVSDAARPRTAPPAAPVSRGGGSGNQVRLSSDEVEMAQLMDMTPEEYAQQKSALQKEGKLN